METFNRRNKILKILIEVLAVCILFFSIRDYTYASTFDKSDNILLPQEQQKLFDFSNQLKFEVAISGSAISGSAVTGSVVSENAISGSVVTDATVSGSAITEDFFPLNGFEGGKIDGATETNSKNATAGSALNKDHIKADKEKKKTASTAKKKKQKKYLKLEEVKRRMTRNMDISKPTGLSKKDFAKLVENIKYDYTGVYKRNAKNIWQLCQKYQVNEIFILGIIAEESGWGSSEAAQATNNYTSQMSKGKLKYFSSEKECLVITIRNLSKNYLDKAGPYYNGTTIKAVNKIYCEPGKHKDGSVYKYKWADAVYSCMSRIVE